MKEIIESIIILLKHNTGYCAFLLVLIGTCVEIVPIKINPISAILSWMGDKITGNIKSQLNDISHRVANIEINDMRSTILDFANSCMNERKHTQEEFNHILELYRQYEDVIKSNNMTNGQMDIAYEYIKNLYTKSLQENSFLK